MPGAEIFIQATETDPAVIARTAARAAHERLRSRLAELTAPGCHPLAADLAHFCRHEVRQYLVDAERDLYAPASKPADGRPLVDALRVGSAALNQQINDLAVGSASDSARIGSMIAGALDLYLRIEESVVPVLVELAGPERSALAADPPAAVEEELGDAPMVIDVRQIARGGRHPRVFARYARLAPGEAFILVNSHDPKPLRREFEAIHSGAFSWDYLRTGPEEWRVRIGRIAADV
ncbi:DUF2249 domain-containing protein [Kribbella pittospori]|uniref:DUF2249 domain-containing protein n=1 Tax=Kribbella pittospori TaxID=722689 RepID=A0A4V6N4F1_9ACTN|nr:DUF2249 domain-containing protein [Kribbella pittospori]TCC44872.1 DUF2249 domain-containing protein [Kribbella pittospori]